MFENIYKSIRINEIKESAAGIAANCDLDNEKIESLAERIAQKCEACVLVMDEYGHTIVSKEYTRDCFIHKMDSQNRQMLYYFASENGGEKLTRFPGNYFRNISYYITEYSGKVPDEDPGKGESIIYTKVVFSQARNRDIAIILNTNISPVDSTISTLRTEIMLITILMIIVAIIASYFFSRGISLPIIRINNGAKHLAEGKYDIRFEGRGYREVSELSDTLNYAAGELEKTDRLQKELIANISHDLRTPLTMIEGYAEMMRDIPGENTPENVQIIIDETKQLSSMVSDLLDISRIQSGTGQLNISEFNLTEAVRQVIGRFSRLTEQEGRSVDFISDAEVMVKADQTKIIQVIYNFINNAFIHSDCKTPITVKQTVIRQGEANKVRIEVTDCGEGIDEKDLPYIWDRYYKVDKHHKRAQTGSGLGLSIVKGILELHGAKYGVNSEVGKGSTFWFEL